jgi:hypothetical protein
MIISGLVMICKKLESIMDKINKIALVIKQQDLKMRTKIASGLKLLVLVHLTEEEAMGNYVLCPGLSQ